MTAEPSLKYFPFHLKLAKMLAELCAANNMFNPVCTTLLTNILANLTYFQSKCKPLPSKALPPISVALKYQKAAMDAVEVKESIVRETIHFTIEQLAQTAKKAWFNEFAISID